jgi:hypothetical protein
MTKAKSVAARRRSRRWLLGAFVILVLGAVITVTVQPIRRGSDHPAAPIGTPADLLVSFPLNRQLVPGWRISATAIGLPPGVGVGDVFATNGAKAYFATDCEPSCADHPTSWVYGLDTRTGARLFAPVSLAGVVQTEPACYQNGSSVALCLTTTDRATGEHRIVSVVDLDHGVVTFTGPTDLSQVANGSTPSVSPVGNYLGESRVVANVKNKGVYGVGPHAELTWFVPGDGQTFVPYQGLVGAIPPLTIAVQGPTVSDPVFRVFSALDGKDLTPTPPKGTVLKRATVYNGGFAYQFEEAGKSAGVLFYDTTGRLMDRRYADHYPILVENAAMPIILDALVFRVYTAAGKLLASIPADSAYSQSPLFGVIGTKLYAWLGYSGGEHWQQWDLLTGERGITCGFHLSGLVGSDGHVVLAEDEVAMYVATDMSTCQTLWKTPTRNGLMQRINTGLIRRTHDEVMSLQPPS